MLRLFTVLLCGLSLLGCTSLRVMDQPSPNAIRNQFDVGDQVVIITDRGQRHALRITAMQEDALLGRSAANQQFKVHYDAIRSVEYRRVDTANTVLGSVAMVGATVIVAVIAFGTLFDDAFCFSDDD